MKRMSCRQFTYVCVCVYDQTWMWRFRITEELTKGQRYQKDLFLNKEITSHASQRQTSDTFHPGKPAPIPVLTLRSHIPSPTLPGSPGRCPYKVSIF